MSENVTTRPAWSRYLLLAGAAVALLLLGAAAGVLIGLPGSSSVPPVPKSDSVDVGFAQDMTVHHEQAVQMATWERDHTTDPRLRQLAFDIESGQSRQIGHMQGWLALWDAAALPTGPHMKWMSANGSGGMDHGAPGSMAPGPMAPGSMAPGPMAPGSMAPGSGQGMDRMPGMATDADLRRLRSSTGSALDTLFLQLMLRHHDGGTGMLRYAARFASVADVRNLASQMLKAQTTESDYMRQLLAAFGAAQLPTS
jgi:uncharacterized protein (DUF305 family)